jgi:hypothetical protein
LEPKTQITIAAEKPLQARITAGDRQGGDMQP